MCTGVPGSNHQELYITDSQKNGLRPDRRVLLLHLLLALQWEEVDCLLREPVKRFGLRPDRRDHLQHLRSVLGRIFNIGFSFASGELQHLLPTLQWEEDLSPEDHRVQ